MCLHHLLEVDSGSISKKDEVSYNFNITIFVHSFVVQLITDC